MRWPRVRPLTIATVAVATALMLHFFPPFPADDPAARDAEGVPLHLIAGMTLTAFLFGDWYGRHGIRGWIDSVLATFMILFLGATVSVWIYTIAENIVGRQWEGIIHLLLELYVVSQFAGPAAFVYLWDWDHLAGVALATVVLHYVGRYERSKDANVSEL